MNVFSDNFEHQWDRLAERLTPQKQREFNRRRLARVRFAQRYRGYLLAANSSIGTGAAGDIVISRTTPLTHPCLVLDATSFTNRFAEIEITRTNPSRIQFSTQFLWNNHSTNANIGTMLAPVPPECETPWLLPFGLEIDELLRVRIKQTLAVSAPERNCDQGVIFRVVGLNRKPCPPAHWQQIEDYVQRNPEQFPVYLPAYSPDAQTVAFEGISGAVGDKRALAVTREVKQPTLIHSFAFNNPFFEDIGGPELTKPKLEITSSDGHSFTPSPVLFTALWRFTGFNPKGPGGGWMFEYQLPVPHYVARGGQLTVEFIDETINADNRNMIEFAFKGITA